MSRPISMSPTTPYGSLIESSMRVVTWNLWWRLGDWQARADAIARTLETLSPDLVCLQEVWQEGPHNQAALLAERLGMVHVFAVDRTEGAVDQGVALLSRWPLTEVTHRALPGPPDVKEPNVVLRAVVQGPRGPLHLATTHLLPFPHRSAERERQVRALVEFIAEAHAGAFPHPGRSIVAGDFNAAPDSDEIRLLTGRRPPHASGWTFLDAWETAGDGSPGYTVSKGNPNAAPLLLPNLRWDYIFVRWPSGRPGGVGHPVQAQVVGTEATRGDVVPSDHYAVLADLRY
jgi:endonuclease/exonuclease/phosphatase family metal-dependent hydrolase